MLDALKLPLQKYAAVVIGAMGVLIVLTGFVYGPYTVAGVTVPAVDLNTVMHTVWPVVLFLAHILAKPAAATTTPPVQK